MNDLDKAPLHIKYRPRDLEEVYGNRATVEALKTVLSRVKGLPHAFLFTGPSGCGKTTIARIIKAELGCADSEFLEYNTSNTRGIDTIREISSGCRFIPLNGDKRIYLLDEVHKLTNDAQNAVLKLLEEPPDHVYFILCTTDPDKLLATILTRCSTFSMSSLQPRDLTALVKDVCAAEGVDITDKIVREILRAANGSPRMALVTLDQIIDLPDEETALKAIASSLPDEVSIKDICTILLEPGGGKWPRISKILKALDVEPEKARRAISGYMDIVILNSEEQKAQRVLEIAAPFMESFIYSGNLGFHGACLWACRVK